jgi:hypothetical protein
MDRLRHDIRALIERQQQGLGDLSGSRARVLRSALEKRAESIGPRTQVLAGIAAVLIAAVLVATFVYIRVHGERSVVPPVPASSAPPPTDTPAPLFPAVSPIHNSVVDGLNCKLPVYLSGVQGSGGFISFPDGRVTPDDRSKVVTPSSGSWFGLTYDATVKRWLPVPTTWVSPDGGIYFFAEPRSAHSTMFEVNAQTGTSAEVGISPLGYGWQVIAVTTDYVFAIDRTPREGLYIMPISSPYSHLKTITGGFWSAAYGVYVFGSTVPDGGAVVRMDARKQAMGSPPVGAEYWLNKSSSAQVLGVDGSGNPVIWTGTEYWIAMDPNHATRINSSPPLPVPSSQDASVKGANAPIADSHGLWFSTTDGIYLYAGGQMTKVSNLVAQVAGPCN